MVKSVFKFDQDRLKLKNALQDFTSNYFSKNSCFLALLIENNLVEGK